ncbi:D-aminopeptidase [Tumebacillus sp. BK434]|uniref:DmpA family aminopeptidase n=1 Tax=Tumebacillus sp. BK434 TaxID=2512169 RepID=UPI00104F3462|nr:P1 family peptidase [Tumebacillus sp. BK434]TCP54513.1 D-aminopeptidase [Tumebacillus sp. BK434]
MKGRIREYGVVIGSLRPGPGNRITDVPGVTVGHCTLDDGPVKTGVTAVLPHGGNLFRDKVLAVAHVINGFGKTAGTIQIEELGTIETPILLTNTLSVGRVSDALVEVMLEQNPEIGVTTGTVNPVVGECNDGYLNDIRGLHVQKEHVRVALSSAAADFAEGAVGAGTGMSCYGLKGGIGSASRVIELGSTEYTLGVLVLSNFGRQQDFMLHGMPAGAWIAELERSPEAPEKGSIIFILATDLPLSERQLKRVSKRCAVGLTRTGSFIGNGSGDVVIGFTTGNRVQHDEPNAVVSLQMLNENEIDAAFRAAAEAAEEAILNSMTAAKTTVGRDGHDRKGLADYLDAVLTKSRTRA